ncbi:hypothetical protein V494_07855 [Pseudogymnoascus sp. VKM F-4513 (FW-928)]|nr:hypothetical protein V494_07855 [Pseudogymnoascus sp. VKM F-4513 (FW-928)]
MKIRALVDVEGFARPDSVLGFAGTYAVLRALQGDKEDTSVTSVASKALETLAGNLRVGIGGAGGEEVAKSVRASVVGECVGVVRSCVVVGGAKDEDIDAGYASMSDEPLL